MTKFIIRERFNSLAAERVNLKLFLAFFSASKFASGFGVLSTGPAAFFLSTRLD